LIFEQISYFVSEGLCDVTELIFHSLVHIGSVLNYGITRAHFIDFSINKVYMRIASKYNGQCKLFMVWTVCLKIKSGSHAVAQFFASLAAQEKAWSLWYDRG
jgi:hypothetical protein